MTEFRTVQGFEDVWRPAVSHRVRRPQGILSGLSAARPGAVRARLDRVVSRAPEVMVKVTGRTRDPVHLRAHLDYISRNGELPLEASDGAIVSGCRDVRSLAADWAAEQLCDPTTRQQAPFSHSIILSMPQGTDPTALRDAARAFAADMFAGSHDYVFALHTDTPRPHVHLSVCSRGHMGERLNPKKADLDLWRRTFAQALRDRGVEAEATPRRSRGVTVKAERTPVRKLRDRHASARGDMSRVRQAAYRDAAKAAFQGDSAPRVWERKSLERQVLIRRTYLAQAALLKGSPDPRDRALGERVESFVQSMPAPASQRLLLARELRAANRPMDRTTDPAAGRPGGDRSRAR